MRDLTTTTRSNKMTHDLIYEIMEQIKIKLPVQAIEVYTIFQVVGRPYADFTKTAASWN